MIALAVVVGIALLGFALSRSTGATPGGVPPGRPVHPDVKTRVEEYRRTVEQELSGRVGLWTALVLALIARESGGDPGAVGDAGASQGLMQIQRATWQDYQAATADPETAVWPDSMLVASLNIRVGAWTLADRIREMGSTRDGLRAYNCGVTGAKRNPSSGADYARWILEIGEPAFRAVA